MNYTEKSNKALKTLIIILSISIVFIIGFVILAINMGKNNDYDYFTTVTGTTKEQKSQIELVLSDCGINEIISIKNDDFLNYDNMIGFYIKTNEYNNVILLLNENDKALNSIKYMGNYLYKDGKLLMTAEQSAAEPFKEFNNK